MTVINSPAAYEFIFEDDERIPVTVKKGEYSTPVWIQTAWEEGELAPYIQKNGCGHCCVTMAARLAGDPAATAAMPSPKETDR